MNDPLPIDLFMTKAAEYLLVIGFLAAFLMFWRLLARRLAPALDVLIDYLGRHSPLAPAPLGRITRDR